MKDRIPTKPGRVLITPENGSAPYYAVMARADEPTEEGTPLNKLSLLSDETAALFGLTPDAVPDDAFAKLKDEAVPKVGDIRYTIRTDLDDRWVLANGAIYDPQEYPELASVQPPFEDTFDRTKRILYDSSGEHETSNCIASFVEAGGYQVALCLAHDSTYSVRMIIHYSTDGFETYQTYMLQSGMYQGKLMYVDGKWVFGGISGAYGRLYLGYTEDITDSASWTWVMTYTQLQSLYVYDLLDLYEENGTFYFITCASTSKSSTSYKYLYLFYGTLDMEGSSWNVKNCTPDDYSSKYHFIKGDGVYVVTGYSNRMFYTTNLLGTWTRKDWTNGPDSRKVRYDEHEKFWYYSDYEDFDTSDDTVSAAEYIGWTKDLLATTWNIAEISARSTSTGGFDTLEDIVRIGDKYYCWCYTTDNMRITPSLLAPYTEWTKIPWWSAIATVATLGGEKPNRSADAVLTADGTRVFLFRKYAQMLCVPVYSLPTVTADDQHVYIKVKE